MVYAHMHADINDQLIQEIAKKIADHFSPEKIILFGSQAWGKKSAESDIDLFIIMESNLRRDKRAQGISKLFSDRLFPLDIIVYTASEVEMSLRRKNPFIREILANGKVLYAA